MKLMLHLKNHWHEWLLLLLVLYYWRTTTIWNPVAIVLVLAFVGQLIFQKIVSGIIIASIIIVLSCYLFLALYSDIIKVKAYDPQVLLLIFGGGGYIGAHLFLGCCMLRAYIKKNTEQQLASRR